LNELLGRWQELREQGLSVSADELCSTCPELAGALGRRIALLGRLDRLLEQIESVSDDLPRAAGAGPASRALVTTRAEYRDLRYHAAGALGEVFVARNAELNREVALKFLKMSRAGDPQSRRRFHQEAEVTGRLEHPGVVPVYALGTDEAGAPCYAMRFIRGETLQDAIDRFHSAERRGRDPSERSLALRDLMNRFVSVCNTVAYAHARGILHRDLKPRNVMLGKYDETLVVDWGLAKPFERDKDGDSRGEEALTPGSESSGRDMNITTVGVVGTPAFMSPEQAQPWSSSAGPASDIFSLGAVLYVILTGQVPYRGCGPGEVFDRIKRGEFPRPRDVKPEVSRALEAICLKAMAVRPPDRYATALELAADVRRWLAGEPVTAYREDLPARARRFMRRHLQLVTGVTAAMLVGVLALAGLVVIVAGSNQTIRRKNDEITRQNRELEQSNRALALARAEAVEQRDGAREVTEFLVSSFRKPDPVEDGRAVTVAEVLGSAVKELERRPTMPAATRATILSALGQTYFGLGLFKADQAGRGSSQHARLAE
jgi:serine/threonine protein kinase